MIIKKEDKHKKTLVYFASGPYNPEYEELNYDRIFLVDFIFSRGSVVNQARDSKVTCLGMDCIRAVDHLKNLKVKVDVYVVLNEGLFEGNGHISLNSDIVLGHLMPILSNEYIHILNKDYYGHDYHVTMNLPYEMSEIHPEDADYLDPFLFSSDAYHKGHAKVYWMKKKQTPAFELKLNPGIKVSIIHDSIWCHTEELDQIGVYFVPQGQGDYFNRIKKVCSLREHSLAELLEHCVKNKLDRLGLTPWAQGHYNDFIDLIKSYNKEYPKEISLFHLNSKDYQSLKKLA